MGKIGKIIYYAVIIIAVLIFVGVLVTKEDNGAAGSSFGIIFTFILAGLAILGTLISSVLFIVHNAKDAKKLLIGMGVLALVCIISYSVSGGELLPGYEKYDVTTESKSKLIDMGMYLTLLLGVGAIAIALVTEAVALFKN